MQKLFAGLVVGGVSNPTKVKGDIMFGCCWVGVLTIYIILSRAFAVEYILIFNHLAAMFVLHAKAI